MAHVCGESAKGRWWNMGCDKPANKQLKMATDAGDDQPDDAYWAYIWFCDEHHKRYEKIELS